MPSPITFWPKELTNKDWQSKKGLVAKIAGKFDGGTGLGDLLEECESLHAELDLGNKWEPANLVLPKDRDLDIIDEREVETYQRYNLAIAPLRKKLQEVAKLAKEVAAEWKKHKLIPKKAVTAAETVETTADQWFIRLKVGSADVDTLFKDGFEKLREKAEQKEQETLKVVKKQIELCEEGLKAALKEPTKKGWESGGAHQGCRSVCNGIRAVPAWKKLFYSTWQEFGDFYHNDIKDDDPEMASKIKAKVRTVAIALSLYKEYVYNELGN